MAELDQEVYRKGAWARTFQPESVGQRQRYSQDIKAAEERTALREEQDLERLALRNPEVGRLLQSRKEFDAGQRNKALDRDFEERKFENQMTRDDRMAGIAQGRLALAGKLEERQLKKAERDLVMETKMLDDTEAVEDGVFGLQDMGIYPGSKEYASEVRNYLKAHPFIDPKYRATLIEDAYIEGDPDEIQGQLARSRPGSKFRATARQDANGRTRYSVTEAAEGDGNPLAPIYKDREYADRQYSRLMREAEQTGDDNRKKELIQKARSFGDRRDAADAKIQGQGEASSANKAPSAAPSARPPLEEFFK